MNVMQGEYSTRSLEGLLYLKEVAFVLKDPHSPIIYHTVCLQMYCSAEDLAVTKPSASKAVQGQITPPIHNATGVTWLGTCCLCFITGIIHGIRWQKSVLTIMIVHGWLSLI